MGRWGGGSGTSSQGEQESSLPSETPSWKIFFLFYHKFLPKSLPSVKPQWGLLPRLGLGLCGLQKHSEHLGSEQCSRNESQSIHTWPVRTKETSLLHPPPHTHTSPATLSQLSSSLKLWFPGSCWSSSGLLRSTFAQGCLCLRADKQLCTLAMPQLPCPLLPDSLLSKGSTGPCLLERNECPKLPGRSKCTAGYSHKGNLSSPFAWRWWWKSLN